MFALAIRQALSFAVPRPSKIQILVGGGELFLPLVFILRDVPPDDRHIEGVPSRSGG